MRSVLSKLGANDRMRAVTIALKHRMIELIVCIRRSYRQTAALRALENFDPQLRAESIATMIR